MTQIYILPCPKLLNLIFSCLKLLNFPILLGPAWSRHRWISEISLHAALTQTWHRHDRLSCCCCKDKIGPQSSCLSHCLAAILFLRQCIFVSGKLPEPSSWPAVWSSTRRVHPSRAVVCARGGHQLDSITHPVSKHWVSCRLTPAAIRSRWARM